MQSPLTRPGLNRSALVGLLAELSLVDHPPAPPSFVEGLAQWLGWKEAIPLSAALQGPGPVRVATASATPAQVAATVATAAAAAECDFNRVRQALEQAIADTGTTAREDGASFVPFRRRYFSLQQAMESATGPLRARLRAAVALQAGPDMARLVALDSALADALAAREQGLLAQMPVLLEKHFSRLRQGAAAEPAAHAVPPAPAVGNPAPQHRARTPSPAWLARFGRDMQRLLLAELDLRLQPAQGLLDTLRAAHTDPLLS